MILLALLTAAAPAHAKQHLVRAGDDWQALAKKLAPGDEVILMPGDHRPARLGPLRGAVGKPIVIRGASPAQPPTIVADRYGLELHQASHIVLQDLIVSGATLAGIRVDGVGDASPQAEALTPDPSAEPWPAHLRLTRVAILRTGREGERHAVSLSRIEHVRLEQCRFEGWAGAAVDLEACAEIDVEDCTFIGREEHAQTSAVSIRAGTSEVRISASRFERAGRSAIVAGGCSPLEFFTLPEESDRKRGPAFEAKEVVVERCWFIDCPCPFELAHANHVNLRNNTIIRPVGCVMLFRALHEDPRFGRGGRALFGQNLIVCDPALISQPAIIEPPATTSHVTMESNLWWFTPVQPGSSGAAPDPAAWVKALPGPSPEEQVMTIDPKLDDRFKPTNPKASLFGADAP
jgi:hypothetical protein